MHPLVRRVQRSVRQQGLIAAGDRVAVAVSGGSDSVALLSALASLAETAAWNLAGVIHVNHGLRPGAAHDDERFVSQLSEELSLPLDATTVDVPARVARERRSVEAVAREARYECFEQAAGRLGATLVATGHTVDDQAETVLLRLMRGAGMRGLSAIRARRGIYIRPVLGCSRSELREYLSACGRTYREDPSNASLSVPRNRVRHQVLPVIASLAPGAIRALSRFAALAAEDEQLLSELAEAAVAEGVRSVENGVQLEGEQWRQLPPSLARRVVRTAIERAGGTANARDIDALLRFARAGRPTGSLDLHRLTVSRRGSGLWLAPQVSRTATGRDAPVARRTLLPVPGRADLQETGVAVLASFLAGTEAGRWQHGAASAGRVALQAEAVRPPLVVRHRERGDRFHPLGAPGTRRLQDVFVDRKVPQSERDRVPVVVDDSGRIVWVPGISIAHHCRVTAPEAGMVILELEKGHQ